ncbi:hypothetical protein B0A55_04070 [Friedmanniomyces simplex]|uniref:Uncharacterized protein n=1 Tax=Friedmanniomyces simplex TaxID=329884 RepID=A0A4U0XQB9_9PEZI|nr:hypothetical protein B0A55_04070 [Friedmanniomyces simplex]
MSSERSSSAVRNLRSIFEVKGSDTSSPDTRGRSRSGLTDSNTNNNSENSRPTSKVRASFVPVETTPSASVMASGTEEGGLGHVMPGLKRESSAGLRRGSFSENGEDGEALLQLKKTVSQEAERRERDSTVPEAIPEHAATSAAVTPMMQANTEQKDDAVEESPLARKADVEPANPDKPTTGAEEDPSELQPAEPTNEAAVSGGQALPPVAEDLRKKGPESKPEPSTGSEAKQAPASAELGSAVKKAKQVEQPKCKPTANGKPTPISTKTAQKSSSSAMKSPASQPKTPSSAKPSPPSKTALSAPEEKKQPSKKASRSSLTAPTAASVARAAGADRSVSTSSKHSPPSKSKAREGTKPIDLPSRLTAPTAASRARHDTAPAPSHNTAATNGKTSTATRTKPPPASTRPNPRASLHQRPDSRASHASKKPSSAAAAGPPPPADGGFLERMMRPTAASSGKTHEKGEGRSPPRSKAAAVAAVAGKGKVNGEGKVNGLGHGLGKKAGKGGKGGGGKGGHQVVEGGSGAQRGAEETETEMGGKDVPGCNNETPVPQSNGDAGGDGGVLEATPAFGGGEMIR